MRLSIISATVQSGKFTNKNNKEENWSRIIITANRGGMYATGKPYRFGVWADQFPWLANALSKLAGTKNDDELIYSEQECAKLDPHIRHLLSDINPLTETDPDLADAALQWFCQDVKLNGQYYRVDKDGNPKLTKNGDKIIKDTLRVMYAMYYDPMGGDDNKGAWDYVNGLTPEYLAMRTKDLLYKPVRKSITEILNTIKVAENNVSESVNDEGLSPLV